jgi:uncharacterized protein (TIRG00374 family)
MGKRVKASLKFVLFLGIGAVLMYFAFRNVDLKKMLQDIKAASYGWIVFSFVFTIAAHLSRAYRWGMLIEPISKRPGMGNLFYSVCSGYLANLAFPRLGEVTRCTVLYEVEDAPFDALVGTVIAERVIDLLTLILLIVITVISNMQLFGHFFSELLMVKLYSLAHVSPLVLILLAVAGLAAAVSVYVMRTQIMKMKLAVKVVQFLKGIWDGLKSVLKLKRKKVFLFHSVFIWLMYYMSAYLCFFATSETAGLGLSAAPALFILVLGGLGMSAPVQGGVGVYHALVAAGLLLYDIEYEKGITFAVIVLSSQWLLTIVLGCISFVMLNIEKRNQLKAQAL